MTITASPSSFGPRLVCIVVAAYVQGAAMTLGCNVVASIYFAGQRVTMLRWTRVRCFSEGAQSYVPPTEIPTRRSCCTCAVDRFVCRCPGAAAATAAARAAEAGYSCTATG